MVKVSEETDIPAPRRRKDEPTKSWLRRLVGSKWHYGLVLVFAALVGRGIWMMPDWSGEAISYVMFAGIVGAGFAMCFAMTRISKNQSLALLTAAIYMTSPYVLYILYIHMSLAEMAIMVAAPILLLGLYQLSAREKHAARYLAIAATVMILANGVWAGIFLGVAAVYGLLNIDKVFNLGVVWRIILAMIVTVGLTAGFVVPLVETWLGDSEAFSAQYLAEYAGAAETNAQELNERRVSVRELIDFRYTGSEEGVAPALGVVVLVGIVGFWFVWRMFEDKVERRFVTTLYIIGVLAVAASTPLVNWWRMPGMMLRVQDPERFLAVAAATLSAVAGCTVFALVRRVAIGKQAVFVIVMGTLAVVLAGRVIEPGSDDGKRWIVGQSGTEYAVSMEEKGEAVMAVAAWVDGRIVDAQKVAESGYDFAAAQPAEIGVLVSIATAGLGVMWVIISGVRDWHKRRKQKQVDSLIDSVWEAMAETESVRGKAKRTQVEKPKSKLLPEPPEPEVPGLNVATAGGVSSDTMVIPTATEPAKKSTRKKRTTSKASMARTESDAATGSAKKKAGSKKTSSTTSTTKTTVRSATTKMKHIKADAEPETRGSEESKPRVTKVKAGTKKEV